VEGVLMEHKDIVYALSILLTVALGIWNLIVNLGNTRRSNFINTVTSQRVKWIEQLRQDISAFTGLAHTLTTANVAGKPEELEMLREIDRLQRVIRLRLNPSGKQDQRMEQLIQQIPRMTDPSNRQQLTAVLEEVIVTGRRLLKDEWDKVKLEAEYGNLNG
jgi:hypothetical protein